MSYSKHFYIERALKETELSIDSYHAYLLTFIAYIAIKQNISLTLPINKIIELSSYKNFTSEELLKEINYEFSVQNFESVPENELISYLAIPNSNSFSYSMHQPKGINELCCKLLELDDNDSVFDMGSGLASFLIYVAQSYSVKSLKGIDVSIEAILRAKCIAEINDIKLELQNEDLFTMNNEKKYDKIFSLPPFRIDTTGAMQEYLVEKLGESNRKAYSENAFILKAIELLNTNGKAVVCVPCAILSSNTKSNMDCKKYLVQNNYLEAIIELPANIFPNTGIKTALFILSQNNKQIKFVNAIDMYTKTRSGGNTLLSDNVNEIYESFLTDTQFSKSVSYSEIEKNDFSLLSNTYLLSTTIFLKSVDQYCKLQELTEVIKRGVQIKDLSSWQTTVETGNYYLSLKNILKGTIDNNLDCLLIIDERYNPYILKEKDVILSLTATDSVKVAIAENISNKKILVSSNLYIIRVTDKMNPYFLKALFETDDAQKLFKSFTVGTALPTISKDFLKKLEIPVPSLSIQDELQKRYCTIEKEKEAISSRLEELINEQKSLFENL